MTNHHHLADGREQTKRFSAAWKKRYGNLPKSVVAALTYDAIGVVGQALRNCRQLTSREVRAQIAKLQNYQGVTGSISFLGAGGNPAKPVAICRLGKKGQEFVEYIVP